MFSVWFLQSSINSDDLEQIDLAFGAKLSAKNNLKFGKHRTSCLLKSSFKSVQACLTAFLSNDLFSDDKSSQSFNELNTYFEWINDC